MSFSDNEKMICVGLAAVSAAYFIGKKIYYTIMVNKITKNFVKAAATETYNHKEKKE